MTPFLAVICFYILPMSSSEDTGHHEPDYGPQGHLVSVREWREGITLGVWNGSVNKRAEEREYNEVSPGEASS